MKRNTAFVALAGAVVLLAGCSAKSGTASPATVVTPASSTPVTSENSSVSQSPDLSAPESTIESGTASSTDASSTDESSTDESSTDESSTDESSTADQSTADQSTAESSTEESSIEDSSTAESTTTSAAPGILDAQSVRWLTTYCTTVLPINTLQTLEAQITANRTDLVKVKAPLVKEFDTAGSILTNTARKLKGVPAPTLTKVGSDLPKLLTGLSTLGATLTADGKKLSAIDPSKDRTAFLTAVQKYAPDLQKVPTVLGAKAGLKIPFAALTEIKRIPSCAKVITIG